MSVPVPAGASELYAAGVGEMADYWSSQPLEVPEAADQMDLFVALQHVPQRARERVIQAIVVIDDTIQQAVRLPHRSEVVHTAISALSAQAPTPVDGLTIVGTTRDAKIGIGTNGLPIQLFETDPQHFLLMSGQGEVFFDGAAHPSHASAVVINGHLQRY